jgi:hypothetical protein
LKENNNNKIKMLGSWFDRAQALSPLGLDLKKASLGLSYMVLKEGPKLPGTK